MVRAASPSPRPALCVALAALLLAGGCSRASDGPVELVVIGGPAVVADPAVEPPSEASRVLLANVAQGLVRLDAHGDIYAGLAETWTVSNDGLSYIFRLSGGEWADGTPIKAEDVARMLRRQIGPRSRNPLRDTLGAISEVVAMTDRVIEIRLAAPRPGLLNLLASPDMGLVRQQAGGGPFRIVAPREGEEPDPEGRIRLERQVLDSEGEELPAERALLGWAPARAAVERFMAGKAELVLGGTVDDLPFARAASLPRGTLRFDPVAGLFGLVPARADGPLGEVEVRRLLSEAIDRSALVAALEVDGLTPRATLLQAGLDGIGEPAQPAFAASAPAERLAAMRARAERLFGAEKPELLLRLPEGPGGQLIFARLAADWGAIGIRVRRAGAADKADLEWIDAVAPSRSPAWFLRPFRCAVRPLCVEEADPLLEEARFAPLPGQRAALLAEAARLMDEAQLFLPIAAPVRWSLVGPRLTGFSINGYAVHPLAGIVTKPGAEIR